MASWNPVEYGLDDDTDELTVFLVGTGAEENAWAPITRAIEALFPHTAKGANDGSWENFVMAKLVAVHRGQEADRRARGLADPGHAERDLECLKTEIARQLRDAVANNTIRLRPAFVDVARLPEWGSRVFLTTNWDSLLKDTLSEHEVHYIHGRADEPATLYLPSDYAFDPRHSADNAKEMLTAQGLCISELWKATTIVIFGLSLDPLDGELAAICATGFSGEVSGDDKLQKVVIYDLARQEETLTQRVRWLLPAPNAVEVVFRPVDAPRP